VEPLGLGAVVLRSRLLAQGFQHGADRGGALGGEVAADHPGVAEGGAELEVAVIRVGLIGVGLPRAPGLDRAGGDGGQVIGGCPGRGGFQQDPVGLVAHRSRELAGPAGDGEGEGVGDVAAGQGAAEQRAGAELAHLPHRHPGALC
jgi:hypothetical protein